MPLVYIPDSVYSPSHYPQPQQYQPQQLQQVSSYQTYLQQQQQAQQARFAPPVQPTPYFSLSPSAYYPQQLYQPQQHHSYPDPIESHKQRLLDEFSQSLNQLYPSSAHVVPQQQPSYEQLKVRYLEERLKEEREQRLGLEQREQEKKRRRREEKEQIEQLQLLRQHQQKQQQIELRLRQQQQQRQQQVRFVQDRSVAPQPQQHRRVDEDQARYEKLVAFAQALEIRDATAEQQRQQKQPQQPTQPDAADLEKLEHLLALAQIMEARQQQEQIPKDDTPTPTQVAYHYIPHPSARNHASSSSSSQPTPAPTKPTLQPATSSPSPPTQPEPTSPLSTLRLLQSRLNLLLSSNAVSPVDLTAKLEKLLAEADGLESGGDEGVRMERRRFVREVERELGRLEGGEKEEELVGSPVVDASALPLPPVASAVDQEEEAVVGYFVPELIEEKKEVEVDVKEEDKKGKGKAVTVEEVQDEDASSFELV